MLNGWRAHAPAAEARFVRRLPVDVSERSFVERIDHAFPYHDDAAAERLIREALAISPNAAFAVLYELVHPPRSSQPLFERRLALIETVAASLTHPAAKYVVPIANRLALGETITVLEAVKAMDEVAPYRGLYAALALVYMGCDDVQGVAERTMERIKTAWEAA